MPVPKISIIIPVVRTGNVKALVDCIERTAAIPREDYEILAVEDKDRIGCPKMVRKLTEQACGEKVMFLGDDTMPKFGFLRNADLYMSRFPDKYGIVSLNDGSNPAVASHFYGHKKMLEHLPDGEFFYTGYKHCYCDNELAELSQSMDRYIYGESSIIEHIHPIHDNAEYDEHYQRAYGGGVFEDDQELFLQRKIDRGAYKMGIALPTMNMRDLNSFWFSFLALNKPNDWCLLVPMIPNGDGKLLNICDVRNSIVMQALNFRNNITHLLMMDTDQIYNSHNMIPKMHQLNKQIVGTVVHRRYPPYDPIGLRGTLGEYKSVPEEELYSGEVIKLDAIGTGCMMIQTPLLRRMEKKYKTDEKQYEWFEFGPERVGEDYYFCHKVRQMGIDIYCDTSIKIDHVTEMPVNRGFHEVYKRALKANIIAQEE
jgi:hypothetical protein